MKKWLCWTGLILLMIAVQGCSNDIPTPQERMKAYISSWEEQDFSGMYKLLSAGAKQAIPEKEFVKRYKNIYGDFEIDNLAVEPQFKLEEDGEVDPDEDGKVELAFAAKMDSFAGTIEFTHKAVLVKEKHEETSSWNLDWNTQMIFPALKSTETEIHGQTLPAKRGEIIDRNGEGLAINGKAIEVGFEPRKMEADSKEKFSEATGIPTAEIEKKLNEPWVKPNLFVPIVTLSEEDQKLIDQLMKIKGTHQNVTDNKTIRVYPFDKAAGHLTGYLGPLSAEQLKELKDKGYVKTDMIGKTGLERYYEDRLRGKDGGIIYTSNDEGKQLDVITKTEPENGETMKLTIDIEKQQALYKQLTANDDAGTAVAINPSTGEVLSLVSAPSYDPNTFNEQYEQLKSDPQKPLINRFRQIYAPGSTFKPITASIGLETGAIEPGEERKIPANDRWQPDSSWGDYYVTRVSNPEVQVNLQEALVYSDNIYFAQTALEIGAESFIKQAKQFGFGREPLPFPIPIEASQITNEKTFKKETTLADSGYGQGEVAMSALHLALAYTPFVNGGDVLNPLLELEKANNTPEIWKEKIISPEIANTIKQDLIQVVESTSGTAHEAQIPGVTTAGKTGTAELKRSKEVENGKQNGWFIAFDTDDPELMIAMMIENIQEGSHYVVPKVAEVMKQSLK